MTLTIHSSLLPHTDPDASLAFFRDVLGFEEPTDQPYGVRDCAFRDPAGNMIRIQELR